jgi:hypothetical protein
LALKNSELGGIAAKATWIDLFFQSRSPLILPPTRQKLKKSEKLLKKADTSAFSGRK